MSEQRDHSPPETRATEEHAHEPHPDNPDDPDERADNDARSLDPRALAEAIGRVLRQGACAVLATLVEAPRGVGAKLLVRATGGECAGSLGDAELDEAVASRAIHFLSSRNEAGTHAVAEFAPALGEWSTARVLFERVEPEPHVVVCGAGHVGASLARLARAVAYRVTVIDDRADFVTRERFPDDGVVLVEASEGWARAVSEAVGAGRGVAVAVVTRGHNEDEQCLAAVLAARPDYVGMIGSRRRTNIVLERLREAGFAEEVLREVRAPVGLDIGAVAPEEVALSILSEMVAARRGGSCAPLSAWRRA